MKIQKYSVETIRPHKRPAIWGQNTNSIFPIAYLRKPEWMTEAIWAKVVKCIRFDAPSDILEQK